MKILRGYKVELITNNKQSTELKKHCGGARWAYNWALNKKIEALKRKDRIPNFIELSRELTQLKRNEIPWMKLLSKCAPERALKNCDLAFQSFLDNYKNNKIKIPQFRSKKRTKQSFVLRGIIKILDNGYVQLPKIGILKLKEKNYVPQNVKILFVTISLKVRKWFAAFQIEEDFYKEDISKNDVIGVDLGIKNLATCSDGIIFKNHNALNKNIKSLTRIQKIFCRKKKGSKNREKAKQKLAKIHYKIANIRKDALHKATSKIVSENKTIVLEDIKIYALTKKSDLSRSIINAGFYSFREMIEYKLKWNNKNLIIADRFYPSSQICSKCNTRNKKLTLKNRVFKCCKCNFELDRDLNAALNLKKIYTASSAEFQASGDKKVLSAKEESN